jgi:hypothetical protein
VRVFTNTTGTEGEAQYAVEAGGPLPRPLPRCVMEGSLTHRLYQLQPANGRIGAKAGPRMTVRGGTPLP